MIEGMIGGAMMLLSFVGGYFFRKKEDKAVTSTEYVKQDSQLPPEVEEQLNNIAKLW